MAGVGGGVKGALWGAKLEAGRIEAGTQSKCVFSERS